MVALLSNSGVYYSLVFSILVLIKVLPKGGYYTSHESGWKKERTNHPQKKLELTMSSTEESNTYGILR
jgi:hypothetical protein